MSAPYFEVDWRWFAIAAFAICMASQYVRYFFARQELSRLRGQECSLALRYTVRGILLAYPRPVWGKIGITI